MADDRTSPVDERGRPDWVVAFLFLLGLVTAFLAVALAMSTPASREGPAGVACAIVSAGAFIAFAITRTF